MTATALGGDVERAWNRELLHADTATPEALVSAGLALPLLGSRGLVVVRGLTELPAKAIERFRTAIAEARALPGGWPVEGLVVLCVAPGTDRRTPLLGLLPEGDQVEVRPPTGRAVTAWLMERGRSRGLELDPEAAGVLVDLVGEDPARLAGEIEKVAVFAGADRRVTPAMVHALAGESRVHRYWELTQALEAGKREDAVRSLEQLLALGEEPAILLALLVGHVRDLCRVRAGLAERPQVREVARLLPRRRPDWAVERLMARATSWSAEALDTALARCFEVERRLKSSGGSPRALLTVLLTDLAR